MHSTYVRRQKDNKPKETNQQASRKEEKEEEEGKNKAKQKTFEMLWQLKMTKEVFKWFPGWRLFILDIVKISRWRALNEYKGKKGFRFFKV